MKKRGAMMLMWISLLLGCSRSPIIQSSPPQSDDPYAQARSRMVETQIRARGIRDPRVLKAMEKVPRHRFALPEYRDHAYEDTPLPIRAGQTMSQPYIVALMTELLQLRGDEKVLEVGTGSGYHAAILAELAREVYTIEIEPVLSEGARRVLQELGYQNIHFRVGDGYQGWPEAAPFEAIVVTAAPREIPPKLVEQLKEGGRMVIPVGTWRQELLLVTKTKNGITTRTIAPVRFVPMRRPD